jgi:hypothetical protein
MAAAIPSFTSITSPSNTVIALSAALEWALKNGVPIGGWCPKGRKAKDGVIPAQFDLKETPTANYLRRTEWNVRDSDGTVIITLRLELLGGSALTAKFTKQLNNPCLLLNKGNILRARTLFQEFPKDNNIRVLIVAGPRASNNWEAALLAEGILDDLVPESDLASREFRFQLQLFINTVRKPAEFLVGQADAASAPSRDHEWDQNPFLPHPRSVG